VYQPHHRAMFTVREPADLVKAGGNEVRLADLID
jgi:hypothetical protein